MALHNSTQGNTQIFLSLISLAFGSFIISTSEFASMGLLSLFADGLGLSVPEASNAITAYALGVVVGAPLITIGAARVNKRTLLIILLMLAVVANLLTAMADGLGLLLVGRFLSGLPQGAYFGAATVIATTIVGADRGGRAISLVMGGITVATIIGAPVGTLIGQAFGWRTAYAIMAAFAALATGMIMLCLRHSPHFNGGPIRQELSALRRGNVWLMLIFASVVVASLFAVYTFVGPLVTRSARMGPWVTPIALALIGIGMALGNIVGGYLADRFHFGAMLLGFVATLAILALMAMTATIPALLLVMFIALGFVLMTAVPTIPLQMMKMAPEAPTLMGAMNMASFNIANAVGAAVGGLTVHAGWGLSSAIWAGFGLTAVALVFFVLIQHRLPPAHDSRRTETRAALS